MVSNNSTNVSPKSGSLRSKPNPISIPSLNLSSSAPQTTPLSLLGGTTNTSTVPSQTQQNQPPTKATTSSDTRLFIPEKTPPLSIPQANPTSNIAIGTTPDNDGDLLFDMSPPRCISPFSFPFLFPISCVLFPISCFLFPVPYSLFPIPYSLFPIPYSLFPIPYSLFPIPYSLFPIPYSLFPISCSLLPTPYSSPFVSYFLFPTVYNFAHYYSTSEIFRKNTGTPT
jgi:hypothetical protein